MFGDDQELRELRQKWPDMSPEEKKDTFLWKMVWFHHQKHVPGNPNQAINDLTETLKDSSASSERLTRSIRNATWIAAVVGGLGVLVAAVHLLQSLGILSPVS
ncbi:MAG: hypothetical protein UW55_C0010G0028 [Candidatus Giovannonibacteria bacterium GW2011_GWA2_44_26]|uniref:Uncharacterized protein n=1 Tax=Candidatus Giovannonibacteria bacterium GW2011_GWA2_44_26 TaxID=1618648 RepID=A0A0G1LSE2_9BACT|nr:MAG: hypothetical protein UW55_C0010G0028 [Candidatus Giovannonibacteria bacterium GW2011_GWA2_44_26]